MAIPKIIHQIWFQGEKFIPLHILEYQKTWKEKNSNYQYVLWDENSINKLIKNINIDWIAETYNSYEIMIQKIDFAKYLILYYIGGIYMDMDIECLKSLDNLLELPNMKNKNFIASKLIYDIEQVAIILFSGNLNIKTLINNAVIMCESRHDIMWDTLYSAYINKNNIYKNKSNFLYIFSSTGPLMLTNVLEHYMKLDEVVVLDAEYFEPCNLNDVKSNKCTIPDKSIGVHRFELSWVNNDENKLLEYYFILKNNIFATVFFSILLFLIFRLLIRRNR